MSNPLIIVGPSNYTLTQLEQLEQKVKTTLGQWGYSEILVLPHGTTAYHLTTESYHLNAGE